MPLEARPLIQLDMNCSAASIEGNVAAAACPADSSLLQKAKPRQVPRKMPDFGCVMTKAVAGSVEGVMVADLHVR